MRNLTYYLLSIAVLLVVILLVTSLVRQGESPEIPPRVEAGFFKELTVEDLQAQTGLPAYWLGETYRDLPIVKVTHRWDPGSPDGLRGPREDVSVIYASCKPGQPPEGGSAEGYCAEGERAAFVDVTSEWLCLKPPSLLAGGARRGPPVQARGALVQKTLSGNTHFHFANSTVIIFASEGENITLEAFEELKGLNPPGKAIAAAASVHLGPPIPEEQCKNFVRPTPQPTTTPEPMATPTIAPTGTSQPQETPIATSTATTQLTKTPTPTTTVTPTISATPEVTVTPTLEGS